jgi:putative oxidoreductase
MVSVTMPRRRSPQWLRILFGSTSSGPATDVAILVVRIALAWIFIYYGGAKLFSWFPGTGGSHGIHQTSLYMANSAHLHPGGLFAVLSGLIEFGGGIAVAAGFFTRLAGLAMFGDMVMAMITVTWTTGINPTNSHTGYQLNIALAAAALAVALTGAGRISVDAFIARRFGRSGDVHSRDGAASALR